MENEKQQNALSVMTTDAADLVTQLSGLSHAEKLAKLAQVTSYTGADTVKIDAFLNQRLEIIGAVVQRNARIKVEEDKRKPDPLTGVLMEFENIDRIIIKFRHPDKKGEIVTVGFASDGVTAFFDNFVFPFFGQGDYQETIPAKFTQTSTRSGGRTYNAAIVV